mgnify:CR=1 FL=1
MHEAKKQCLFAKEELVYEVCEACEAISLNEEQGSDQCQRKSQGGDRCC